MKQGKKLSRIHKEVLSKMGLQPSNYLLERKGIDEFKAEFIQVIDLETNKVERYYL